MLAHFVGTILQRTCYEGFTLTFYKDQRQKSISLTYTAFIFKNDDLFRSAKLNLTELSLSAVNHFIAALKTHISHIQKQIFLSLIKLYDQYFVEKSCVTKKLENPTNT